ncbi:hypothetical protein E6C60_2649 [Paenibacillus algicola]|uniref:Uncharacterized protein n=1 Tax=Paenibacillus algicola TaxID=2565926 RepID=A0A4P8XP12_9BACL|nr:hypothetical protein [Paenibacillus algicola]QCT03361.1 hypothetical protein E6C60_2649 [Paenibacillus algicola]
MKKMLLEAVIYGTAAAGLLLLWNVAEGYLLTQEVMGVMSIPQSMEDMPESMMTSRTDSEIGMGLPNESSFGIMHMDPWVGLLGRGIALALLYLLIRMSFRRFNPSR